jgi:hypothetical protein
MVAQGGARHSGVALQRRSPLLESAAQARLKKEHREWKSQRELCAELGHTAVGWKRALGCRNSVSAMSGLRTKHVSAGNALCQSGSASSTHESYLSEKETGVAAALRAGLHTLLGQEALPDNPAFFLASVIMAYQDRAPGWSEEAETLLAELDASSPMVHDASRLVCKLSSSAHAWGLPHVIRAINAQGLHALHKVLVNDVHNSFFCVPAPFQVGAQGAVVRVMCSLQGSAVSYNPARQLFPKLQVRADVLISGLNIEASVDTLGALILRDARDVQQMPLNSLVAVRAVAPVAIDEGAQADRLLGGSPPIMTSQQIEADSAAFLHIVKKAVLASMVSPMAARHDRC